MPEPLLMRFKHSRQTGGIPRELKETLQKTNSRGMLFDLSGKILVAGVDEEHVSTNDSQDEDEVEGKTPSSTRSQLLKLFDDCDPEEKRILKVMALWRLGKK